MKPKMSPVSARLAAFALSTALAMPLASAPAGAQELAVGGGIFDVFGDDTAGEFRLEYRFAPQWWQIHPFVGATATTDGGLYGFGGLGLDIDLGTHFVVTPSLAAGLYHDGSGKDLGSPLEFRSALEFAYRFDNRSRLGVVFSHISNAGLEDENPGAESLVLMFTLPFGR